MKKLLFLILIISSGIAAQAQTNYERDTLAQNDNFQQRVRMSSISAAKDLLADPQQPNYVVNYCQLIVSSPFGSEGSWLDAMSYGVASAPAINSSSTDSDIQFTVNSIIVNYAKAYYRIIE